MTAQTGSRCRRIIVLDTSAFLSGYDPFSSNEEQVTVPSVEEEIKRNTMTITRFTTAIESGKLKVKAPSQEFLNATKVSSSKLGDSYLLSKVDTELLALALDL